MTLLQKLRDMLGCRLCWRVALAVFLLILVVESAILVPSAQRFERNELAGGLVAIIVLVVTAGTMLVLHFSVLRPLLALRGSALANGADPGQAERCTARSRRRDAIKIERSFAVSIGTDHRGEAICDTVLGLGQALGTRVIAKGVAAEAHLEFLRRRRCDEVQGYLIGKPVTAVELERCWIAARATA